MRVSRESDKRVYQPRIHVDDVGVLYRAKLAEGKPMTVLLHEAIEERFKKSLTPEQEENSIELKEDKMDYAMMMDEIKANSYALILTPGESGWRMEFMTDTPHVIEAGSFADVVESAYQEIMTLALPI